MPSVLTVVAGLLAAYLSTFIYYFVRNLIYARKSGFPTVIIPWDQNHLIWMVLGVPLRPLLQRWLPKSIWQRVALTIYGFEFHERRRPFEQYAAGQKSYMHVGVHRPEFWTCDQEIATEITRRPRDFLQQSLADMFMARFGHNVLTTNGDRWARQRKIVASVINDRVSKAVFIESVRQVAGLVEEVFRGVSEAQDSVETNQLFEMMKRITIHVLSGATMGSSVPFSGGSTIEKPPPGYKLTYMESVKAIINATAGPIILPKLLLNNYPSFLPGHQMLKALGYAVEDFPAHTKSMLEQERARMAASAHGEARGNIMSQLLQASESSEKGQGLTQEEMMGNLFIFSAAGFDTTANTLSYALVLLARYPEWQQWLLEEVDRVLPVDLTSEQLEYSTVYPQATRMLALMYETLRLFTPVVHVAKMTVAEQALSVSSGEYWLPAGTTVYVNSIAVHLSPEVYRNVNLQEGDRASDDDEARFRPSRWLNPPGSVQPLWQAPKGAFLPWSAGPRVCPGMSMAKVEFSAVMLTLLRHSRLEAVALDGENREMTDKRLDARMRDSMSVLTLQMNGVYDLAPGEAGLPLRVVRR
ncbi:hypothetical protein LTR53_005243 [Teratosphaeriaceae sp. CCFEE 6253]|nr:hypothetical protein LTR53_005243 [Teratosphaeriaceae sp. CCFEE 6253]